MEGGKDGNDKACKCRFACDFVGKGADAGKGDGGEDDHDGKRPNRRGGHLDAAAEGGHCYQEDDLDHQALGCFLFIAFEAKDEERSEEEKDDDAKGIWSDEDKGEVLARNRWNPGEEVAQSEKNIVHDQPVPEEP